MNRLQERKLSMYEVVFHLLSSTNASIISQMPQMSIAITLLGSKIAQINDFVGEQITNRTGTAATKEQIRLNLIEKTEIIARKVEAYAVNADNTELAKKVKYTFTGLEKMADNIIVATATLIHDTALERITDLAPYNIDNNNLVEMKSIIDDFYSYLPKPRTGIIEKKEATAELRKLFSETDHLLNKKIDILVGIVKSDEPHFYNNYSNSRILIDPGFRTLSVRCLVTDNNEQIITGATIKIKGTTKKYTTKTKGYCYIKSLPEGTHDLIISKEGYTAKLISIPVVNNERTDIKVILNQ